MVDLHEREADVADLTSAENPEETVLCDVVLALFESGFELLNHEVEVQDVRVETAQLLAMACNSLRWSQEQLVKGYYAPAVTMARNAWECWLAGAYLSLYPERLEEWKRYETRPRPRHMRKLVADRTHADEAERAAFREAMDELYGGTDGYRFSGYSVLSHPSWEAIRILVRSDADELWLRVGPDYDRDLFRLALDSYCTAGLMGASLFLGLLTGDEQEAFLKELDAAKDEVAAWRKRETEP